MIAFIKEKDREKKESNSMRADIAEILDRKDEGVAKAGVWRRDESILPCMEEIRPPHERSRIVYRDCKIDYTRCHNQYCIKKLV